MPSMSSYENCLWNRLCSWGNLLLLMMLLNNLRWSAGFKNTKPLALLMSFVTIALISSIAFLICSSVRDFFSLMYLYHVHDYNYIEIDNKHVFLGCTTEFTWLSYYCTNFVKRSPFLEPVIVLRMSLVVYVGVIKFYFFNNFAFCLKFFLWG